VIYRPSSSIRSKALMGGLSLLAFVCASAQAPLDSVASHAAPLVQPVPLVAGACPTVRPGGVISLDWNPGFNPSSAVTGLKFFRLIFHQVGEGGVSLNPSFRLVLDSGPRGRITDAGNGYFHIESRLPPVTHPGTYHLVGAVGSPELVPDYQGDAPKMTVSPVSEFFCVTVVPASRPSSSSPPE
jgi:hypothetical protein